MMLTPLRAPLVSLRTLSSQATERLGLILLGSGILALTLSTVMGLRLHSPFGHDESVYALKARDLAASTDIPVNGYWTVYRAPGIPAILSLVFRVGESAIAARVVIALFSVLTLWCVWAIGRKMIDPVTGGLAALLTATTPAFAAMSTFVLVDGPGVGLSLLAIVWFLPALEGQISWWRVAAVVVCCWAATAVRFGAPLCFGIGLGALGTVAVVRAWQLRDWSRIGRVLAAGIGSIAAVPGLYASQLFANANGASPKMANDALRAAKQLTIGTGLRDLRTWFSTEIVHQGIVYLITLAIFAGVAAAIVLAVAHRHLRLPVFFFIFCAVGGLAGLVISVGLIQTNYLMIVMPFVTLASATGFVAVGRLLSIRREWLLTAVALSGAIAFIAATDRVTEMHRVQRQGLARLERAALVTADQLGAHCMLITSYFVQTSWYSNCAGHAFPRVGSGSADWADVPTTASAAFEYWLSVDPQHASPDRVALLIIEGGKRQPPAEQISDAESLNARILFEDVTKGRTLTLSQLQPCFFTDTCSKG